LPLEGCSNYSFTGSISAACILAGVGATVFVDLVAIVTFFSSFNDTIATDRIGAPTITGFPTVASAAKLKGPLLGSFKIVV
jgi:hypothetical protein